MFIQHIPFHIRIAACMYLMPCLCDYAIRCASFFVYAVLCHVPVLMWGLPNLAFTRRGKIATGNRLFEL